MSGPRIDVTDMTFNSLTALSHVAGRQWLFRCDCGNTKSNGRP
jgi:hypothetical protein